MIGERTGRAFARVVALAVVALTGTACDQVSDRASGEDSPTASTVTAARPSLVTTQWAVVDGMLSVVVRNTTDRTLHRAEGVITARDRDDAVVTSSRESRAGACCAVVDLPPGAESGLYVDVGDAGDRISRVEVAYRDVAWAPVGRRVRSPVSARAVELVSAEVPYVVADVRNTAPMVAQASVQAFLNGPDGEFLAVVAGHWFCFSQGRHQIRMEFPHRLPAKTTVDRVVIRPVPDAADGTAPQCAGPARTR